eukprot:TRINITY_DN8901_c0_g1_i1.p1 TRINITY_DN8901_c0_g1~~TRINITY_DN8901_c0_g1_i1.p1  ORF type:complete len:211 (+),score=65.96 TRINITY_DN8901_c0_g1_i1:60-692(+)
MLSIIRQSQKSLIHSTTSNTASNILITRTKFQNIIKNRGVGKGDNPRHIPTLRQLLTHLDQTDKPQKKQPEIKKKKYRRYTRAIGKGNYVASQQYAIAPEIQELTLKFRNNVIVDENIMAEKERIEANLKAFNEKIKRESDTEKENREMKIQARKLRKQIKEDRKKRIEEGIATKEDYAIEDRESILGEEEEEDDEEENNRKQQRRRRDN